VLEGDFTARSWIAFSESLELVRTVDMGWDWSDSWRGCWTASISETSVSTHDSFRGANLRERAFYRRRWSAHRYCQIM